MKSQTKNLTVTADSRRRPRSPHAAKTARTARMYGTPVYVWKNGKVVAEKP